MDLSPYFVLGSASRRVWGRVGISPADSCTKDHQQQPYRIETSQLIAAHLHGSSARSAFRKTHVINIEHSFPRPAIISGFWAGRDRYLRGTALHETYRVLCLAGLMIINPGLIISYTSEVADSRFYD